MNLFNHREEPARLDPYQDPASVKVNKWVWRNFGYIILILTVLTLVIFMLITFMIVGGSCLDSGNYYNHLNDCASIIGGFVL